MLQFHMDFKLLAQPFLISRRASHFRIEAFQSPPPTVAHGTIDDVHRRTVNLPDVCERAAHFGEIFIDDARRGCGRRCVGFFHSN